MLIYYDIARNSKNIQEMRSIISLLIFIWTSACVNGCSLDLHLVSSNKYVHWTLKNTNGSIHTRASVPGGVYSDLRNARVIGDILSGFNDVLTRWVAYEKWTYTASFKVNQNELNCSAAKLVLHGVDTVSFIEVNGRPIGSTNNMFVRYVFDVKEYLKVGENDLTLRFESPVEVSRIRSEAHFTLPACVPDEYHGECHVNQLRKMQASYAWDWGPAFPSVGLWKPAVIEFSNDAIIRSVTTHIQREDLDWNIKVTTHLEASPRAHITGQLTASLTTDADHVVNIATNVAVTASDDGTTEIDININISQNAVRLWWPNGFGDQPLYPLHVIFASDKSGESSYKHIHIGFRTIELVENNASSVIGNTTGGDGLTFFFRINGYPLFMKGSNWIPAHILPEHGSDRQVVDSLLKAARDAHMSMLRVWGGGVYESDYFYKRCDQLGILIWQDFLFACSMYPADTEFLQSVKTEIEQNVIRLQHHPSIAVWAGNNENEVALRGNWYGTSSNFTKYKQEYISLYVDTIRPIVQVLDPGRRYLISSPSNGIESEKEGYIARNPYDPKYGDTHYYNYLADNWNQNMFPRTRFASEYGFQSLPSIKTMRTATNNTADFNLDSVYSKHRQHSPNGYTYIQTQMGMHLKLEENDPNYFEKFIYFSQIIQAMAMKAETEFYRQSQEDWYTMGALYWQLNDVWQAPSWSGIEYNGKWKMLHYFAKSFFAPVLVSPRLHTTDEVDVYLINDRFVPILNATIRVDVFNWTSLIPISTALYPASVAPLSAKKQDVHVDIWNRFNSAEVFLRFSLNAEGVPSSPLNFVFPKPLKDVKIFKEPRIQISVSKRVGRPDNKIEYVVDIRVDTIVLFLWLDIDSQDGYFEDNGFIITQPYVRVNYITKRDVAAKLIERRITYKYYIN